MRVFIGVTEIAGYYGNLQKGFRELGVTCDFINLYESVFYHKLSDGGSSVRGLIRWIAEKNASTSSSGLARKVTWKAIHTLLSLGVFLWALPRYDVFIFAYGISFLFLLDLPVLKFFGKKLIFVFNGSDTRPGYIGFPANRASGFTAEACIRHVSRQKKAVRTIERYADGIVCHTLSAQLLEKPFVQFLWVGIPFQPPSTQPPTQNSGGDRLRILHSPSNPSLKGSPLIRQAISNLRTKGYKIDYIEISGKPNSVVLEELAVCDFVVDELYSDSPMAGLATEAAFFGKPTITAGYARNAFDRLVPVDIMPPSEYCHPSEIESAIEMMINDREFRVTLGDKAQAFVASKWTPRRVAEKYYRIIQGSIPCEWLFDPNKIDYFLGAGAPEEDIKEMVRQVIEKAGVEALQMADKPDLENSLIEFACC